MSGTQILDRGDSTWKRDGACTSAPNHVFFPEQGQSNRAAKALCAVCPVTAECLDFALRNNEPFGVWGGTTALERKQLRRELRRRHIAICGTDSGYHKHRRDNTPQCGPCKEAHAESERDRQERKRKNAQGRAAS